MIILGTAVLFHVMAKHGVIWKGVAAAWIMAALLDAALLGFLILAKYY